jgi:hypothetical protein
MFLFFPTTYWRYLFQSSDAPQNCGFVRWVNPTPIHLHQDYIEYLQNRIFDLETKLSNSSKVDEDDENSSGAGSQEALCNDPYCNYPYNKKKGPPPLPPTTMGGYS